MKINAKNRIIERLKGLVYRRGGNSAASREWNIPLRTLASYLSGESDPKISNLEAISQIENLDIGFFFYDSAENCTYSNDSILIPLFDGYASHDDNMECKIISNYLSFGNDMAMRWGRNLKKIEATRMNSNSMEPTISNGAVVLIDTADKNLTEGGIFAFLTSEAILIRRFQCAINGGSLLISDNRDYMPETLSRDAVSKLKVKGRVFWTEKMI